MQMMFLELLLMLTLNAMLLLLLWMGIDALKAKRGKK